MRHGFNDVFQAVLNIQHGEVSTEANCSTGYRLPEKKRKRSQAGGCGTQSAFSLADRPEIQRRWTAALRHQDTGWSPNQDGMCELNFLPEDFIHENSRKTMAVQNFETRCSCFHLQLHFLQVSNSMKIYFPDTFGTS